MEPTVIKLTNQACINAPASEVWRVLADLESVPSWGEPIKRAQCDGDKTTGVGASRVCDLSGGVTISELWTAWDEGKSFEYDASGMPLIKRATNRWTLQPAGDKTLVVSEAEIELKGGIFAKLLEPLLRPAMKSMGPRTLAALAYLVENGKPYINKHRTLPLLPTSC